MSDITVSFEVRYEYRVLFTRGAFSPDDSTLARVLEPARRVMFVLDSGLVEARPRLQEDIVAWCRHHGVPLAGEPMVIQGGEAGKDDPASLAAVQEAILRAGLCRHSMVVGVGGGAVLDTAGFAAATAHRGVGFVRMPTTVLAQNDAGVGVKNGVNRFGVKNYLGAFAPPVAVVDDFELLETLPRRDWIAGVAEAIKVAVIKDGQFFHALEDDADRLRMCEAVAMERMIRRCAEIHVHHIASGGDPFERGSGRPLDFGHWSAHRLEELTHGELRHGEAVAIGIALDSVYAAEMGMITWDDAERIVDLLCRVGLPVDHPMLGEMDMASALESFREHLGGELTITLPHGRVGSSVNVHRIDLDVMGSCVPVACTLEAGRASGEPRRFVK